MAICILAKQPCFAKTRRLLLPTGSVYLASWPFFSLVEKLELSIDEVDALTGPVIGRPKSATFRTADVVGIDTLVKVAKGVYDNCPADEARETFTIPAWLEKMVANNWLGDKTGQGFFKKIKLRHARR